MTEPPDKYRCLKVPITSLVINKNSSANDNILNILNDAILRTNAITHKTYLLLRLWILKKYHNNIEIPEITI